MTNLQMVFESTVEDDFRDHLEETYDYIDRWDCVMEGKDCGVKPSKAVEIWNDLYCEGAIEREVTL